MHIHLVRLLVFLFMLAAIPEHPIEAAWPAAPIDPASYRSPSGPHKLIVSHNPESSHAPAMLSVAGATAVAEYGAFTLVEADDATLARLEAQARAGGGPGFDVRDDLNLILLNTGPIDTSSPSMQAAQPAAITGAGRRLHLVQFIGPVRDEWLDALAGSGAQLVSAIPNNAYLIYGDTPELSAVQALAAQSPSVQWSGPYLEAYRIQPGLIDSHEQNVQIQLVRDPAANAATLALLDRLRRSTMRIMQVLGYTNIVVRIPPGAAAQIAAQPDVVSIAAYQEPEQFDEGQGQIVAGNISGNAPAAGNYLGWLAAHGFTQAQFATSGFAVDITDSGVDNATVAPNHFALYTGGSMAGPSRMAYARLEGTPNTGASPQGSDGHGTLNAHIIGGFAPNGSPFNAFPHADTQGLRYGLGIAPFVRLGSSVIFDNSPSGTRYTSPSFPDLQSRAFRDGARISNNSWGVSARGPYTADSQAYDALVRDAQPNGSAAAAPGNQEMVILFAAGNTGAQGAQTIGTPGSAKNVITVGASENVRPIGGADSCGTADAEADSLNDMASFSSRGPTADGRTKPDIVAPGTRVSGGVYQAVSTPPPNGQAAASFLNQPQTQVCGMPGSRLFPAGQEWYTLGTGTSFSTPAVAGGAALLRQFFINRGLTPPSPAMTKAYLVNYASYLTGAGAGDTLFSSRQGMGLLTMGPMFEGSTQRLLSDQQVSRTFSSTGQTQIFQGTVASDSQPLRVSLAWTDSPGPTSGAAYLNNLDLTIQIAGVTYRGNMFQGATSVPGGTADLRNNLESVFLPAGIAAGTPVTITVTAANIIANGIPNNTDITDQDFALVASNVIETLPPPPEEYVVWMPVVASSP